MAITEIGELERMFKTPEELLQDVLPDMSPEKLARLAKLEEARIRLHEGIQAGTVHIATAEEIEADREARRNKRF